MTAAKFEEWILHTYEGTRVIDAYSERSFFYNPNQILPRGIYFTTIKEQDGPNDRASDLNRADIYRVSLGIGKTQYQKLFGNVPKRPEKGKVIDLAIDFRALEVLMPHPIYAWMGWIAMNNPTVHQLGTMKTFLDMAYFDALKKYQKRMKNLKQPLKQS